MTGKKVENDALYKETFCDVPPDSVFLLGEEAAVDFWDRWIDGSAIGFFKLEDDNWVVREPEVIGAWVEAYNNDHASYARDLLTEFTDWGDTNGVLHFCMSRLLILRTTVGVFCEHWDSFLEACDDCPILLGPDFNEALIFTPTGYVQKAIR